MPYRLHIVCTALLLLTACTGPSEPRFSPVDPLIQQTGRYQQHLVGEDGWRIWRYRDQNQITCLAVKSAPGQPEPELDTRLWVPFGGAGFYMVARQNRGQPYFGFYGRHPYDRISMAEHNGTEIADVDDRDRVLDWEGETVRFRVNTLAQPGAAETADEQRGELDFTGVRAVLATFEECLTLRPVSEPAMIDRGGDDD